MRTTEADPRLEFSRWALQSREAFGLILFQKWMAGAGRDFRFPPFRNRTRKDGAPACLAGVRLGDTGSLGCARDDRFVRGRTNEDARAYADWRGLVQRSFVGSRVCATPLPQDDSGRLDYPWAFSRVGSSISGSGWPCLVSEVDGVRLSRLAVPTFPRRTRKDGAPACLAGEIGRHRVPRLRSG
jgi:hypothetical protein